jgi:hypothetical protein
VDATTKEYIEIHQKMFDEKFAGFKETMSILLTRMSEDILALKKDMKELYSTSVDREEHLQMTKLFEGRIKELENRLDSLEKIPGRKAEKFLSVIKNEVTKWVVPFCLIGILIWASHGFPLPDFNKVANMAPSTVTETRK